MSRAPRLVLACALLALAGRPTAADDRLLERVERALVSARGAGEGSVGLATLRAEIEQRDRAQQAEFDAAAARPLPPKARQRLQETRRAWAEGQGRLLQILGAMPGAGVTARSAREPAADLDEALELLRRIRAASRTEPLSEGELKNRAPDLHAPALAVSPVTQVAAGDEPPIGTIAPEVRQEAASLPGPIEAYEWVRNTIRPELYHGVMKGPLQTLRESSGNDADTAGLLIALLRAKGIPARYVRGTVELPAAAAVALTATASPERAVRAFERAGIPNEAVSGAGGVAAIRVERVWVEAYLPYANYRGALLDAFEKAWVPLDPGYKRLDGPHGLLLRSIGFDPATAFDDYLRSAPGPTPLELYRQRAQAALTLRRPDLTYGEALARRDIVPQSLGLLPSTLPYAVVAKAEVGYAPPEPLVHRARFLVEGGGTTLLDASFAVPDLLGQRLTLSYVPFEADDEEVVRQYGGLFLTPPYLVEVKPVLKLGGIVLASGVGGAGLGVALDFRIELTMPGGGGQVDNRVVAGNLTAIGLAAGQVTADEDRQDEAAQILARLAFHYLDRWNRADDELAGLLRVVPVRPSVSTCLVQSAVQVEYAGGDPLYPVRYDWKGLSIDADRRPSAPVGIESNDAERDFLLASGLEGSVLENRIFEDDLQVPSVSTAKALQLAEQGGVDVLDLGPADAEGTLPGLPLDEGVKEEIRAAAAQGYRIRVPAAALNLLAWTGTGYLILDPDTGESAWQLQGGHSGGVTAPAVVDLPSKLVDVVYRQSETPSPQPGAVTYIQKFDTTDLQTGTVDALLPKAFKVLVTDDEGFPVPAAPVTFSVIGGGGTLVDPASGRASASEVTVLSCSGGEKEEPCASLKPGEAVATLRLGQRTDGIPRYTCEEPYTCTCPAEGECDRRQVGYATQVGMNLVTARSGAVALAEPFTTFAFPERKPVEGVPGAIQVYVGLSSPPVYNPVLLTVADRMAIYARDRLGNPISNVLLSVAYEGPPELGPPPPGGSLYREATTTPGHVLEASDYQRCLEDTPSIVWGQCPGEAESVEIVSSSVGAFAYPLVGDSPWSYYKFNVGTTLSPAITWVKYHTNGLYCPAPSPTACAGYDAPQTFVWQGTRPVLVNLAGNLVEAYAPGSRAEVGLWADVVYEEARVTRTVDAQGHEHFKALGTNVWRRERLEDSEFQLQSSSPGTSVDATASPAGEGRYAASMTLGPAPELNSVDVRGRHFPPLVKYVGATGGDVDPSTVDPVTSTLARVKDPDRPIQIADRFDLWGVEPRVTAVVPTPVFLGTGGLVTQAHDVLFEVRPPEYRALLTPNDQRFELRTAADEVVLSANGAETPQFRIPAGLPLPEDRYYARVSVRGVSGAGQDLSSDAMELPVCSLLDLETPEVEVRVTRDPLNGELCGSEARLRFRLCRAARVSVTIKSEPFTASLDGAAAQALTDLPLPPGLHEVVVPAGLPELESDEVVPFRLLARDEEDPTQATTADGIVKVTLSNRAVLPVGHTFVKGVDLLDGHVVQQSTDLKVPGRHLGLEVTRTYSSAGWSSEGPLGGGWALNYGSGLFVDGSCGIVTVMTADGSSQVFHADENFTSFTPQKGYHTRLEREGNVYRFIDKAGNVHHFESLDRDDNPRLDWIEEPHGDRLELSYDGAFRLVKVAEVQPEVGEVRSLAFSYRQVGGFDRITRVESGALGLRVDYEYGDLGDLTRVTRNGLNVAGADGGDADPRVEEYRYLSVPSPTTGLPVVPTDVLKRHQLVGVTDPNGHEREYVYYADTDTLPGEVEGGKGGLLFPHKWELAKEVVEHPDPALAVRTSFLYDLTHVARAEHWTTVRDGRGNDTLYVLNGNGSPLRIEEPLGRTTAMAWASDDVLKKQETDPLGRVTDFGYDARGNLTSERISTSDLGVVETRYEYDPRFNKLTYKRDAEGRETRYTIDPATGDLRETLDAAGNRSVYVYDEHGRLRTVADPRSHVTIHRGYDSFGNAGEIEDPLGNVVTRTYDLRGRLVLQSDTMGHETRQSWDGLDRLVRVVRVAGGDSDDEVTQTAYYPGGETRSVTNANGAVSVSTIDGLGRVVATETRLEGQTLTTAATWDANGNKETETDRRGVRRRFTYDALNRLTRVEILSGLSGEGPLGRIADFGYDLAGNKKTETDLAGRVTRFEYDGLYRVKARILPEAMPAGFEPSGTLTERYAYDRVGNRTSVTDPNGHETTYAYDGLDRLVRTTNALDETTTVAYDDPEGSHVDKSEEHDLTRGLRTTYVYDELNREKERVVHLEGAGGGGVAYATATAYDDTAHSVSVTDPRGVVTLTKLDGLDRPSEQTVDPGPAGLDLVTRMAYDGLGSRKSLTDPENHTTRFRFDGLGRLVETTDARSETTTAVYDGEGLKTRETDRRGVTRTFSYDNLGRPRRTTLVPVPAMSGVAWSQETRYLDAAQQRIQIDGRGQATVYGLDGLDRAVTVTDPAPFAGQTARTKWDGVNKREETDRRGHTTKYEYDAINRLAKTTDPPPFQDQTVETAYDDPANRVTEKDRRGNVSVTQLDPLGRVVTVTRAVGTPDEAVLETNLYDGNGNKTLATDAEGHQTKLEYDAANRLSARTDGFESPEAATTTFVHDKAGNQTEERDQRAADLGEPWSTKRTYDELNRLETETNGESDTTTYGYDPEGNRTSVRAPRGPTTTFEYDELGKLTKVTQPAVLVYGPDGDPPTLQIPVTSYAYDENRNRILQTDANLHSVKMEYDELNRLKKTTQDPGELNLVAETTRFDANGNPEIVVDPNGQTTTSTYDELNRLHTKSFTPANGWIRPWRYTTSLTYGYDENGNLTLVDEAVASGTDPPEAPAQHLMTRREWDELDRLKKETQPLPDGATRDVDYTYYRNGSRKTVTENDGPVTFYEYDGQNRLKTTTTAHGTAAAAATRQTYWPDDLLRTVTYPNGVTAEYGYDRADRLLSVRNRHGTDVVSSYEYSGTDSGGAAVSYDPNGNRLIQVETNGGVTETTRYTYDDLDRLASVSYPVDATYPTGRVVSYGYDSVGNRVRETERDGGGSVLADRQGVFDSINRLSSLTDVARPADDPNRTTTFGWDANGNQVSRTVGSGPAAVVSTYVYDLRDKLVEARQGAPTVGRFQYDFEGRRSLKIGEEGLRQYVYDQTSLLAEYDDGGVQKAKYDYGSDRLISLTRTDEPRRYFSLDGLRSVVNLTNDSGTAVASYHLDAWGNFRFPDELTHSANRFAFTGHIWDEETGLYNAKARYFDPKLGRFLTQDSFLGQVDEPPSLHRYLYANDNPLAFVDPTGHTAEGAELQGVLRETKDYFISQAKGDGILGKLKGVGFGILAGAVGLVESTVGLVDEAATATYTVPGVDVMGDPTGVESRQEIKQQVADLKQTYHVIKEEGFFNAASRIAGNAKDTLVAAAKGDPQSIAKVTAFATEMVGPTVALKGSGALGAMRRGAEELVEGAGRAIRHGWEEAATALRRGGDDLAEAGRRYAIGERLPNGLIAGEGPGAGPALREAFIERGPVQSRHYSESLEGTRLHEEAQAFRQRHAGGSNPRRNYVTADVEIDGATRTARFKNDPGGMHSEQRLVAWQRRMQDRLRKQGKDPSVFLKRVYTERPPCGALSENCRDLLGHEFGQYLEVYHGDR